MAVPVTEISELLRTKPGYTVPFTDPFMESPFGSGLYTLTDADLVVEDPPGSGLYVEA